jgi:hypothetical protein
LGLCVVVFCVGMKIMLKMMKEKSEEDEERKKIVVDDYNLIGF